MTRSYADVVRATQGLVAYWRLGESGGEIAYDSFAEHHGRYRDVLLGMTGALLTDGDTATALNGETSAIIMGEGRDFEFIGRSPFTLEAWVKMDEPRAENARIVSRRLGDGLGTHGYEFVVTAHGAFTLNRHNGADIDHLVTQPMLAMRRWTYVVATFDGKAMALYVDGEHAAEIAAYVDLVSADAAFELGRRTGVDGSCSFAGTMDEVAVSACALTSAEVRARFAASGRHTLNSPSQRPGDTSAESKEGTTTATVADEPGLVLHASATESVLRSHVEKIVRGDHAWRHAGSDRLQAVAMLVLPMMAAFAWHEDAWVRALYSEAARFMGAPVSGVPDDEDQGPAELYLWARFIRMACERGAREDGGDRIARAAVARVESAWSECERRMNEAPEAAYGGFSPLVLCAAAELASIRPTLHGGAGGRLKAATTHAISYFARCGRWTDLGEWGLTSEETRDRLRAVEHLLPVMLESLQLAFVEQDAACRFFEHLRIGLGNNWMTRDVIGLGRTADPLQAASAAHRSFVLGLWSRLPGDEPWALYRTVAATVGAGDARSEESQPDSSEPSAGGAEPGERVARTLLQLAADPAIHAM